MLEPSAGLPERVKELLGGSKQVLSTSKQLFARSKHLLPRSKQSFPRSKESFPRSKESISRSKQSSYAGLSVCAATSGPLLGIGIRSACGSGGGDAKNRPFERE